MWDGADNNMIAVAWKECQFFSAFLITIELSRHVLYVLAEGNTCRAWLNLIWTPRASLTLPG